MKILRRHICKRQTVTFCCPAVNSYRCVSLFVEWHHCISSWTGGRAACCVFTDCPYGDRTAGCAGQVDADYCKEDAGVREQCCGTCRTLMRRESLDLIGKFSWILTGSSFNYNDFPAVRKPPATIVKYQSNGWNAAAAIILGVQYQSFDNFIIIPIKRNRSMCVWIA